MAGRIVHPMGHFYNSKQVVFTAVLLCVFINGVHSVCSSCPALCCGDRCCTFEENTKDLIKNTKRDIESQKSEMKVYSGCYSCPVLCCGDRCCTFEEKTKDIIENTKRDKERQKSEKEKQTIIILSTIIVPVIVIGGCIAICCWLKSRIKSGPPTARQQPVQETPENVPLNRVATPETRRCKRCQREVPVPDIISQGLCECCKSCTCPIWYQCQKCRSLQMIQSFLKPSDYFKCNSCKSRTLWQKSVENEASASASQNANTVYVQISGKDGTLEIPIGESGVLTLSEFQVYFPNAVGLKYETEKGTYRVIPVRDSCFHPPQGRWGDRVYVVIDGAPGFEAPPPYPGLPTAPVPRPSAPTFGAYETQPAFNPAF